MPVFLRAGRTGEGVRWDRRKQIEPLREKSREARLDVFFMRKKYLPSQTELQHNSERKPETSIRSMISPLIKLSSPLLCH